MPDGTRAVRQEELLAQMGWVEGLARALVRDEHAARDVAQETWRLALERPPGKARSGPGLRAWLAKVVRNLARRDATSRARRARREHVAAVPEAQASTLDIVERADMRKRVINAVMELDEPYRSTVLYRYFDGLSAPRIARQQGVSSDAARKRLSRGLALLRVHLDHEQGGDRTAWCSAFAAALATGTSARDAGLPLLLKLLGGLVVTKTQLATGAAVLTALTYLGWQAMAPDPSPAEPPHAERSVAHAVDAGDTGDGEPPGGVVQTPATAAQPLVLPKATTTESALDAPEPAVDPVGIVLYGQVSDPQGRPVRVRHGSVRFSSEPSRTVTASIREDSTYATTGLRPGPWTVETNLDGFKPSEEGLILEAGEPAVRLDLVVRPSIVLRIKVLTPEGEPLEERLVEHAGYFGGRGLSAIATRQAPEGDLPEMLHAAYTNYGIGVFKGSFGRGITGDPLPAGYVGTLELDEALPAFVSLLFRHVVLATQWVEMGSEEVVFQIPVERVGDMLGSVRLKVVDATSGMPLAQAMVGLSDWQSSGGGQPVAEDGSALLVNQRPGLLELEIRQTGYERFHQVVRVQGGQINDLGVIALHRATSITGRVLDEDGQPVSAWLSWFPLDRWETAEPAYSHISERSNTEGNFKLTGVGRGEHVVRVSRGGLTSLPIVVDTSGGSVEDVEVRVEKGAKVILDAKAGFQPAVDLTIVTQAGLPVRALHAWRGGRFTQRLVPATYLLTLTRSGATLRSLPFQVQQDEVVLDLID